MGRQTNVVIHTPAEIAGIRRAAAATAEVRDRLAQFVQPGLTTADVDRQAEKLIRQTGGSSAFLGYHGFPGQICISINQEVIHGIGRPERVIMPGDVVSMDVGVRLDGYVGDTALTLCAGTSPGPQVDRLLQATREALAAGVEKARAGNYINHVSTAVEAVVKRYGFSVVRDFVGHGCGCELHEPPEVPNFARRRRGEKLVPGMVLAIEPMVNCGSHRVEVDRQDKWTVRTVDGSLSAHYEHMVLITRNRAEILTCPKTKIVSE